jgi:hypothetical protein
MNHFVRLQTEKGTGNERNQMISELKEILEEGKT